MYNTKTSQLIRQRYSCRTFQKRPLGAQDLSELQALFPNCSTGPLGNQTRFQILPASDHDSRNLPKLGTYGFAKDPAAFLVGVVVNKPGTLVDFGYSMEHLILKAVELGLGSCWLGGTFTKSRFAHQMDLQSGESIPAVASLGYPADHKTLVDRVARSYARADRRFAWEKIFFTNHWKDPIDKSSAGVYSEPLHLVQLAPSASNKQPWRLLQDKGYWHFYLERNPNYTSQAVDYLLDMADLQMIDMGIAVAHFDLGLKEKGLPGNWIFINPGLEKPGFQLEYIISWKSSGE